MIKDKSLSLISFKCFIFFSNLLFILSSIVPEQNNIFCVSGVFTDAVSEQTLRSKVHQSTFESYNIIVPDLGTYAGQFMIASLEYAGEYNGEVTYSITLESSGDITFTSA